MRKFCILFLCAMLLLLAGCGETESYDTYEYIEEVETTTYDTYDGEFTVYARVPDGWGDVYLWAGASGLNSMFPEFPGMLMEPGEDGWCSIPVNAVYEYVVISANGGAAMTDIIYCGGEDMWVICDEAAYTYSGFQQGSGMLSAAADVPPDFYGGMTPYYRLLESMKQPDTRIVSEGLEVMAMLAEVDGIPVKMEYGFDGTGLKEISIQNYYDMDGASSDEISDFIQELRNFYQTELSGYGCVHIWDDMRDAYIVLVIHCTDLDVPEYSRTTAYLFGGGDIPVEGEYVRMPTEAEAQAMGYYVRYY